MNRQNNGLFMPQTCAWMQRAPALPACDGGVSWPSNYPLPKKQANTERAGSGAAAYFILYDPVHLLELEAGTRLTAKNTCRRLYLAWQDHNHRAKIAGPAPAQWMDSLLSHSASDRRLLNLETKLASITSLSASRLPPPPEACHWPKWERRPKNIARPVIGCW